MDENDAFKPNEKNEKRKVNNQIFFNDLVIQLSNSISENSISDIIESLNFLIKYAENFPLPLNSVVLSYDFMPSLIFLYNSSNEEISMLTALLLFKISYHPRSEIIECLVVNHFFEQILERVLLYSNQNEDFIKISLKCIKNILIDFSSATEIIYKNPEIIENFIQLISTQSLSNMCVRKIIDILSFISSFEIEFNQKLHILDESIRFLNDTSYELFWSSLLCIPASMIINNDSRQEILEKKNVLQICQNFIRSDDKSLIKSAIRCVGRHFLYSTEYICIDFNKIMKCALSESDDELSYISLWLLSNALATNSETISLIENDGNIYDLLYSFFEKSRRLKCKYEAANGMYSIIRQGTKDQIKKAIKSNFISALIQSIEVEVEANGNEIGLTEKILKALNFLFNVKIIQLNDINLTNICWNQFYESCGDSIIENLVQSDSENISLIAQDFLKKMKSSKTHNNQWV